MRFILTRLAPFIVTFLVGSTLPIIGLIEDSSDLKLKENRLSSGLPRQRVLDCRPGSVVALDDEAIMEELIHLGEEIYRLRSKDAKIIRDTTARNRDETLAKLRSRLASLTDRRAALWNALSFDGTDDLVQRELCYEN